MRVEAHPLRQVLLAMDTTPALAEGTTGIELAGTTEGVTAIKAKVFGLMLQCEARQGLKALP